MSASRKNSRARSDDMTYWTATCAVFSATERTLQQGRAPALREPVVEILACERHGVGGDDVAKGIVRRLLVVTSAPRERGVSAGVELSSSDVAAYRAAWRQRGPLAASSGAVLPTGLGVGMLGSEMRG
jgi:hypothetical protein